MFLRPKSLVVLRRYAPKYLQIPAKPLTRTELERARQNLVLLDLPFSRVNQLLNGLYKRRVMGKRKPTLRRMVYAVFQLELHAWSMNLEQQQKKRVKRRAGVQGTYLEDLRGLHFQQVLERLTLIHYGKHRCLSYADQTEEYRVEVNHIALHVIQACMSMWIFKRRIGRTVGGYSWPTNPVWIAHPKAFVMAIEGVAATRMRALMILRGEVERKSKPVLIDVELPKKKRLADEMNAVDEGSNRLSRYLRCKKQPRRQEGPRDSDVMDVEANGNVLVSQKQESKDDRKSDAKVLSNLTPMEINSVFDAIDTQRDTGLSPVRELSVLQWSYASPN